MTTFALTTGASDTDIVGAINYALANVNLNPNALQVNQQTGVISVPNIPGTPISYLYQYLYVVYATNSSGTTGFSTSPTNATYYGLRNDASNATYSTNPADYIWYQVSGGFGTTNVLYYLVTGSGNISLDIASTAPNTYWLIAPTAPTPIDLTVITNVQDISGLVTNGVLNADTVGTTQLVNGSVTNLKIATNAVTTAKIAAGAITNSVMAANAISSTNIINYSIQTIDLNTASVTSSVIADHAVGTNQLNTASVTSSVIADHAVGTNQLNTASVTTNIIAPFAITTALLNTASVTTAKIAPNAITTALLNTASVTTNIIADYAVGTLQLNTASVNTSKIAPFAITTALLNTASVTSNIIANYAVGTGQLNTASVTSDKLSNQTTISIGGSTLTYSSSTVNTTATYIIDTYSTNNNRNAKYIMQVAGASNLYEACELLTLGGDSAAYITSTNVLSSSGPLGVFGINKAADQIQVEFTPNTTTTLTLTWQRTIMNI